MRFLCQTISLLAVVAIGCVGGERVSAQVKPPEGIVYTWTNEPLQTALYEIADFAGIAIVFAHRLVESHTVSAAYKVGDDPQAALEIMLDGTGLRAERIRRGRYVIISEPLNVLFDTNDPAAFTGTMRGRVIDAETNEPLWGAHVWLVEVDLGDVVEEDGSFSVPGVPTGEYLVRFSHIGYKPIRSHISVYPVSPQRPPTIRLQPEIIAAVEATIESGAEPETQPGSTDLAARQAAALPVNLGEGDLAQTLVWLPGLSRSGAGRGELAVRGADPSMTHYIRDGVPFFQPWHAFGMFLAFQPEALRSVRFHKGSLPAELGDGLAGVVELETRDGLVERPAGTAALSPVALRAILEAPLNNRTGLFVAARRSTMDWVFPPSLNRQSAAVVLDPIGTDGRAGVTDVGQSFYDAEARLSWNPREQHRLTVGGYVGGDHLSTPSAVISPGLATDNTWTNQLGSIKYSVLGRRAFVSAQAYHSRFDAHENIRTEDESTQVERDYEVGFRESGGRIDLDYFHSVAHQLRFGFLVRNQQLKSTILEGLANRDEMLQSRNQESESGVVDSEAYFQDVWQPAPGWRVQLGARGGLYSDGEHLDISPRVHARWTVKPERFYLRGGISRQIQTLHRVRDRYAYTYDLATSRWLLSDGPISPASAWQVGLGAEWVPDSSLAFSIDTYGRRLNNVLEPIDPFSGGDALLGPGVTALDLLRFYRPSEGRAYGVELAGRAEQGSWVLGLSYALSRAEVGLPGESDRRLSRYDRPHAFGLLVQRRGTGWSAAARLTVQSGLPTVEDQGDQLAETRFPTEVHLDLSAGYRFRWLGFQWEAQAQALNIAGRPSLDVPTFADGSAALLATDVRSRSLLPLLSLKATW